MDFKKSELMKGKLTAIIVDDERLARNDLRLMLSGFEKIEVIGEANGVINAQKLITQFNPDVIFLDIQMRGETGFDLLEKIPRHCKIIFVTAYDEFALKAFDVNALDYLLKPVNRERLAESIERLFEDALPQKESREPLTTDDRLFLLFNSHYKFIKVEAIVHISAAADYSEVHLQDGQVGLVEKPMQEWEERLPSRTFCRIHRSAIINMDYVIKVEEWFNYAFRVTLKGVEEPFVMSRRYASAIKNRMG